MSSPISQSDAQQAFQLLHESTESREASAICDSIDTLSQAVSCLAQDSMIATHIGEEELSALVQDLTWVAEQTLMSDEPVHCRLLNHAIIALKAIEETKLFPELQYHVAYHGGAIRRGLDRIRKVLRNPEIDQNVSLRKFVRKYCDDAFRTVPSSSGWYLLRPCSSIPSGCYGGEECRFVTLSYRKPGEDKCRHALLAKRVKAGSQEPVWSHVTVENNVVSLGSTAFHSLPDLLQAILKGNYDILPQPGNRDMDIYVAAYIAEEIPLEEQVTPKQVWEADPILCTLYDDILFDRYKDPICLPSGHTVNRATFESLEEDDFGARSNPFTREPVYPNQIRSNLLAAAILQARVDQLQGQNSCTSSAVAQAWEMDPILREFRDPLTCDHLMVDLRIAPNGVTYDLDTLLAYLRENDGCLPTGEPCDLDDLVPNRVAMEILANRLAKLEQAP